MTEEEFFTPNPCPIIFIDGNEMELSNETGYSTVQRLSTKDRKRIEMREKQYYNKYGEECDGWKYMCVCSVCWEWPHSCKDVPIGEDCDCYHPEFNATMDIET